MWLDVDRSGVGVAAFIPRDFVFEGGLSKRQGVTTQRDTVTGDRQFFKLDYSRRIEDIIALVDDATLPSYARNALSYYRDIYLGIVDYEYERGSKAVADLMYDPSLDFCDIHSGYSDLLDFLVELSGRETDALQVVENAPRDVHQPRNIIYFGAPGTGKSYELSKLAVGVDGEPGCFNKSNVTRVTFHPDYAYAQFVGCFKPFIEPEIDEESPASAIKYAPGRIEYKFVPGPFINTYVAAIGHPDQNYLLIIEEINRANPAAVFGDVFQLLDRKEDGTSEYSVATSEDLHWYMFRQWKSYLNGMKPGERNGILHSLDDPEAEKLASSISLPPNMYIWATMNSADQGVFPMDTAFKRRWDFRYMGINDGSAKLSDIAVPVGKPVRMVSWDALRRGINEVLLDAGVNEDKLLGPFFIPPPRLRDTAHFTQIFMDKVLLYLFEDAAKTKKSKVFSIEGNLTYSDICDDFKARGELAFKGMKELASVDDGKDEDVAEPDSIDGEV
ncbi:AAA domain-containing protein [Eggerthellaceae bacterium zg-893]|nr:AAA domain-containing protein [Eggerthellaceae bacterium zg-893]